MLELARLIKWAHARRAQFFLRAKSNEEWEAGWGDAAGPLTVRADTALAAMKALYIAKFS